MSTRLRKTPVPRYIVDLGILFSMPCSKLPTSLQLLRCWQKCIDFRGCLIWWSRLKLSLYVGAKMPKYHTFWSVSLQALMMAKFWISQWKEHGRFKYIPWNQNFPGSNGGVRVIWKLSKSLLFLLNYGIC